MLAPFSTVLYCPAITMSYRLIALLLACVLLPACATAPKPAGVSSTAPEPRPVTAARPTSPPPPADDQGPIIGAGGISKRSDVQGFIAEMVRKHGFSTAELMAAFDEASIHPSILESMAKPYEAKPWYQYRKLFLTEKRIQGGLAFKEQNAEALQRAKSRFGVSPDIVTAIIGIESAYGKRPGRYRVIDSLSTLAFAYPRRAAFFRGELEQFLLLCRDEGIDYLSPVGSYAGAMGMPQFMPSSFRKLAADGDGDGRKDIWNNPADAIASVANYFDRNGWHTGEPIAVPATVSGGARGSSGKHVKANRSLAQLADEGAVPAEPVPGHLKGALVELPGEAGPDFWIVFHNFGTIMRYNNSPLYAMAAFELSRELAAGR
jgi:membrane-bound lytic murein transglycosylase B